MIIINSLYENRDITDGLEGLIPLDEGGILASQENLRKAISYQLSHANDFLKYLYYPTVNPLSQDDFIDEKCEAAKCKKDKKSKNKILDKINKSVGLSDKLKKQGYTVKKKKCKGKSKKC